MTFECFAKTFITEMQSDVPEVEDGREGGP